MARKWHIAIVGVVASGGPVHIKRPDSAAMAARALAPQPLIATGWRDCPNSNQIKWNALEMSARGLASVAAHLLRGLPCLRHLPLDGRAARIVGEPLRIGAELGSPIREDPRHGPPRR